MDGVRFHNNMVNRTRQVKTETFSECPDCGQFAYLQGGDCLICSKVEEKVKGGIKHDQDKLRYELLPPEFLEATADILTFGAKKYSARNWEEGMDWSRVYGALQRHLWAWMAGEDNDTETGKSHLWHACCCIAFLTTYEMRGIGNDDR